MRIDYDDGFDSSLDRVFQVFPDIYGDDRGNFTEVLKSHGQWPKADMSLWFSEINWIRQINRSISKPGTVRGCHAQRGQFCQAKLVESLTVKLYDIITDARPNSNSFGLTKVYVLDPSIQNKLFVPRGFLHAFAVPFTDGNAIFQYFCDNIFDKKSEVGVNPMSVIPKVVKLMKQINPNSAEHQDLYAMFSNVDLLLLSDKDCKTCDYDVWMNSIKADFDKNKTLWYK